MKHILLLILIIICPTVVMAQHVEPGTFDAKRNIAGTYNFWLYTPAEYKTDKHPLPVIIFLHGAILCGNNLARVRRYGPLDAIEKGKIINTFVLAPQNPGGAWNPKKVLAMLEWVEKNYAVDTTRVYVFGMSLGGYGTLDFTATYPEKVAAAMALCGGASKSDLSGLGKVPLWIMHGTADRAVSIQQSKRVVSYLQGHHLDSLLRYDWGKGYNHAIYARFFYLQKVYDWLVAHSTKDNPREVDRNFSITDSDIRSTYQDLKRLPHMFDND